MDDLVEATNFLNRSEVDTILGGMTARDIFAAIPNGTQVEGAEVAGKAFEAAAERQGYGKEALDRVRPGDAIYLAQQLGEAFAQDSPKAEGTEDLPISPGTGDSAPSL
jgi:hypothetical protein